MSVHEDERCMDAHSSPVRVMTNTMKCNCNSDGDPDEMEAEGDDNTEMEKETIIIPAQKKKKYTGWLKFDDWHRRILTMKLSFLPNAQSLFKDSTISIPSPFL